LPMSPFDTSWDYWTNFNDSKVLRASIRAWAPLAQCLQPW